MKSLKVALALALGLGVSNAQASHEGKKVEDVVTAVIWVGHETAEAAVAVAGFTRDEIAKPLARDAKELAILTKQGAIAVSIAVKNGVVAVSQIVVKGAKHVYSDALNPFYTVVIRDAVYSAGLKNGVYKMFLQPVANGAVAGAYWGAEIADKVYEKTDDVVLAGMVAVPMVAAGAVAGGAVVTYDVLIKGILFNKALKPAGKAIGKGGKAAGKAIGKGGKAVGTGVWKALKWYAGTFEN